MLGPLALSEYLAYLWKNKEPTSVLAPLTYSLRVISQVLQGFARGYKYRMSKPVSLLSFARCCTALRSRWYQSGINIALVSE